jgi:hypothetical protein
MPVRLSAVNWFSLPEGRVNVLWSSFALWSPTLMMDASSRL